MSSQSGDGYAQSPGNTLRCQNQAMIITQRFSRSEYSRSVFPSKSSNVLPHFQHFSDFRYRVLENWNGNHFILGGKVDVISDIGKYWLVLSELLICEIKGRKITTLNTLRKI
jgi:hypothetical protein